MQTKSVQRASVLVQLMDPPCFLVSSFVSHPFSIFWLLRPRAGATLPGRPQHKQSVVLLDTEKMRMWARTPLETFKTIKTFIRDCIRTLGQCKYSTFNLTKQRFSISSRPHCKMALMVLLRWLTDSFHSFILWFSWWFHPSTLSLPFPHVWVIECLLD